MIILWLLILMLVVWLILFKLKRKRMYELAALIPSLSEEIPVIGVAHKLVGSSEDIMSALQRFSYESMKKKGIIKGWLSHKLYFITTNPVDVEMLLKTCLEKDDLHRFIRSITGNGTIFAPVSVWRHRRKILLPAFSPKIIESFVDMTAKQSEILVKQLRSKADGKTFSVWNYISNYTFDSVCESSLGASINAQENPEAVFIKTINTLLHLICERIFHLWLQPEWMYRFFPQYQKHEECIKTLQGSADEIIKKRIEELKIKGEKQSEIYSSYDLSSYSKKSFLDHLISLSGGSRGYSVEELRDEVLTIIGAGTDTSAVAISNVLKLLAKYQDIQEKVYAEVREIFGEDDRPLVKDDLMKLKYLERVIKETMRLYPSVPFIIRKIEEETTMPSGCILPAGSGVCVSIWGLHRDPKYWGTTAEQFDPDRFLTENYKPKHPCCFIPFSNGPRNCVGYQYAINSTKIALSAVLRRYRVLPDGSPEPNIAVKLEIMMKAVDGYQISLQPRKP